METNTCILETRNEIVGEWGIHRHGIQLPIITGVNIGSLKVSFLELNDCAHIYELFDLFVKCHYHNGNEYLHFGNSG